MPALGKHSPAACSRSLQSLWVRLLCTCRTAWCPSPWSGGSWGGSGAQTRAAGRGWWGRPWCTRRWGLPGSGYTRHSEDNVVLEMTVQYQQAKQIKVGRMKANKHYLLFHVHLTLYHSFCKENTSVTSLFAHIHDPVTRVFRCKC